MRITCPFPKGLVPRPTSPPSACFHKPTHTFGTKKDLPSNIFSPCWSGWGRWKAKMRPCCDRMHGFPGFLCPLRQSEPHSCDIVGNPAPSPISLGLPLGQLRDATSPLARSRSPLLRAPPGSTLAISQPPVCAAGAPSKSASQGRRDPGPSLPFSKKWLT